MRLWLTVVFLVAFIGAFSLLESKTVVFRTLTSEAHSVVTPPKEATVLFVGDMMFDRYIRTVMERGNPILTNVAPLLSEADLNVGNLEGPITDNSSQSQGTKVGDMTNMRFTFSPRIRTLLKEHRFDLVSLGNNHIMDFGAGGARSTTAYLSAASIAYVGDPTGDTSEPIYKDINGVRVAFVAYSDFRAGDGERTRAAIAEAEGKADVTVVLSHWGNEYEVEPPTRVRDLATSFVESGADLIIGSHPHIIGSIEDIGRTRVYYSLGNFIFDQYWEPSVRCGLAVKATFTKTNTGTTISFTETQVGMKNTGETVLGCS